VFAVKLCQSWRRGYDSGLRLQLWLDHRARFKVFRVKWDRVKLE